MITKFGYASIYVFNHLRIFTLTKTVEAPHFSLSSQ